MTGSVTFNKAGYCQYASDSDQNPVGFLVPAINFTLALKTFGTYSVSIKMDYLMKISDELSRSTTGTAYASAIADDFFKQRGGSTITVDIDDDLKNSLSQTQQDALTQTVLYDQANQFLTALLGVAGERRTIRLPDWPT